MTHIEGDGENRIKLTHIEGGRTPPLRVTLGNVVAYFKYQSTKNINIFWGNPRPALPVWQRDYYERIIRDERELFLTRQYITDNPKNWDKDSENIS